MRSLPEQRLAQVLTELMIQGLARSMQKFGLGMLALANLDRSQDFVEQGVHLSLRVYCSSGIERTVVPAMLKCWRLQYQDAKWEKLGFSLHRPCPLEYCSTECPTAHQIYLQALICRTSVCDSSPQLLAIWDLDCPSQQLG